METGACGLNSYVYPSEDLVDATVFAGTLPPSFDNTSVVPIACEVVVWAIKCNKGVCEELESNRFCPPDVTAFGFPVADELPHMPMFSHNNAKACS